MKKIIAFIFLLISMLSCSTMKNDTNFLSVNELPFQVLNAKYKVLKINDDATAYALEVTTNSKKYSLDTAYFSTEKGYFTASYAAENPTYIATFSFAEVENDIILDKNPEKEFGNKPPKFSKESPFELEQGEAVITFFYKGEVKYYKLSQLQEIK